MNPSLNCGALEQLFKMSSSHAVRDLLDPDTLAMVQEGQSYASHEVVFAVSQCGYVPS